MTEVKNQRAEDDEEKRKVAAAEREAAGRRREGERRAREEKKARANKEETAKKAKKAAQDEEDKAAKTPIPFGDARLIAKAVTTIQDEKQVILTPEEFAKLKKVLEEYGNYNVRHTENLSDAQVIVLSQEVLRKSEVAEPEEEDFASGAGSKERKNEEALARLEIKEVREGEELTADKIQKGKLLQISQRLVEAESAVEEETVDDETPGMVETYPHIANMNADVAAETLKAAGIDVELPQNWDRRNEVDRFQVLERLGVSNTTAFPQRETETVDDLRFIDGVTGAEVYGDENGYSIINYASYKRPKISIEDVNRFLRGAGSDKKVEEPDNWSKMTGQDQRKWLKKEGVNMVPKLEGGGTKWPDNNVDSKTLYARLKWLRDYETDNGTADFLAQGYNNDRSELYDRLSDTEEDRVPDLEKLEASQVLNMFQVLKEWEDERGTANFNAAGLDRTRTRVVGILINSYGVEQLFEDLMTTPGGWRLQALQGYKTALLETVDDSNVTHRQFSLIQKISTAISDLEEIAAGTVPPQTAALDAVITPAERTHFRDVYALLETHFDGLNASISDDLREKLFEPVDKLAQELIQTVKQRFMRIEEAEARLLGVARQGSAKEIGNLTGILDWRAAKLVEDMRVQLEVERKLGVPVKWEDSMRNVLNNVRDLESQEFKKEEVGHFRQRLDQIIENIPVDELRGARKDEARQLQKKITEIRDSIIALYSLRLTMEENAMDPDKVLEAIMGNGLWTDHTFTTFFDRFNEDQNGEKFEASGQEFNIMDVGMQVYFERFDKEKKMMNMVEGLSLVDIASPFASVPDDIRVLFGRDLTPPEVAMLDRVRKMMLEGVMKNLPPDATADQRNEYWADAGNQRGVVDNWYQNYTLLGTSGPNILSEKDLIAHLKFFGVDEARLAHYDLKSLRTNIDVQKLVQREALRERLMAMGVEEDKVDEYDREGLVDQVNNNGHNLTWTLGAFSDYDGIRLYKRNTVWFVDENGNTRRRLANFVYSKYSDNWYGRMVDHFAPFLHDEKRGRINDVNPILQKHMLGRRREMLGHNRLMVKFINDLLRNDKTIADSLVAGDENFADLLEDKMLTIENRGKLDYENEFDKGWIRGASIEELIDDGEISFANVKWSQVFSNQKTNVIKYNMGDWWTDRKETKKYFSGTELQSYLNHPSTKNFLAINNRDKFYSTREIRMHPWMKLVIPAHQEIGKHWKEWFDMDYNMPSAEIEQLVVACAATNRLTPAEAKTMKRRYLNMGPLPGIMPVRTLKEYIEMMRVMGSELKKPGHVSSFILAFFWALFKGIFSQSSAQLSGK